MLETQETDKIYKKQSAYTHQNHTSGAKSLAAEQLPLNNQERLKFNTLGNEIMPEGCKQETCLESLDIVLTMGDYRSSKQDHIL